MASAYDPVVWSQGLFLKPEHFQQQQRHVSYQHQAALAAAIPYAWGVTRLQFEGGEDVRGQVALRHVSGVLSDGFYFDSERQNCIPESVAIVDTGDKQTLYLAINRSRHDTVEVGIEYPNQRRYTLRSFNARDNALELGSDAVGPEGTIDVAVPNFRLVTSTDNRSDLECLPIATIDGLDQDGRVVLSPYHIPVCLSIGASEFLMQNLVAIESQLAVLLERIHKTVYVAGREDTTVVDPRQGVFALMQAVRRFHQRIRHVVKSPNTHPLHVYALFADLVCELSCFKFEEFDPNRIPDYNHMELAGCLVPLFTLSADYIDFLINHIEDFDTPDRAQSAAAQPEERVSPEPDPVEASVDPVETQSVRSR